MQNEATLEKDFEKSERSLSVFLAQSISGCSTTNIDTIQTIDFNFGILNNNFTQIWRILSMMSKRQM